MKNLCILGSTGSIGTQTLEVVRGFPGAFGVSALSCGMNVSLLAKQIVEFRPQVVSVASETKRKELLSLLPADVHCDILFGEEGNLACATLSSVDTVVAAMVGMQGLRPVVAAISSGKDIALANKETLVTGGHIVMPMIREKNVALLPVDSEHSAIWQCLWGQPNGSLDRILLTASGGPFRGYSREQLSNVTLEQASAHPTWNMGGKITIDSSSMMNKGLEVIEASWLFNVSVDAIDVVVHPQSIVHSMIRLSDGSVLGQIGFPNMMLPIQVALFYPERSNAFVPTFDPFDEKSHNLTFEPCDRNVFRLLDLAYHAGRVSGSLPIVMNGANEALVGGFMKRKISFMDIERGVEYAMNEHEKEGVIMNPSLDEVYAIDQHARDMVSRFMPALQEGE
ncbi:MAG TPA: 1-deoxy-D-xylulose-5-phosphate reductoisomerase [Bacillota bacterium]|nr:1-deoxy-D-xylulose-5-phosphate reductoisomerase [Bacillota bacterium]